MEEPQVPKPLHGAPRRQIRGLVRKYRGTKFSLGKNRAGDGTRSLTIDPETFGVLRRTIPTGIGGNVGRPGRRREGGLSSLVSRFTLKVV